MPPAPRLTTKLLTTNFLLLATSYTNQLEQYGHVTSKEPLALHPMMARVQIAENIDGTIRGGSDPRAGGGSVTIAY